MTSGTFTAQDQTEDFTVNVSANLALKFGGGTVKLQRYMKVAAEWIDVSGGEWSADTADIIYSGSQETKFRLLCSVYSADIMWEIA